jgi:hypothetical protein
MDKLPNIHSGKVLEEELLLIPPFVSVTSLEPLQNSG